MALCLNRSTFGEDFQPPNCEAASVELGTASATELLVRFFLFLLPSVHKKGILSLNLFARFGGRVSGGGAFRMRSDQSVLGGHVIGVVVVFEDIEFSKSCLRPI